MTDSPSRNWKSWRIPNRVYGGVRTSTLFFGVCFVLTALLYVQVDADVTAAREEVMQGPTAVDPSQYTQEPTYQPEYTTTTTPSTTPPSSSTIDPSTTEDPSNTGATSGEQGSSTSGSNGSTTQDPTYLPGLTVPPELRSLFPPAPQAPSATPNP